MESSAEAGAWRRESVWLCSGIGVLVPTGKEAVASTRKQTAARRCSFNQPGTIQPRKNGEDAHYGRQPIVLGTSKSRQIFRAVNSLTSRWRGTLVVFRFLGF